jgi:hypothetical protein
MLLMNPSFTTTNGVGACPRYFRSSASYEIPFRLDEPVEEFADTESSPLKFPPLFREAMVN